MKYTESQKEIIAFVPQEVLDNKTLTDASKLVYGALVMRIGTEKYKNDGYFFRTNEDIAKECEISIKSVQRAVALLTNMNLIKKTTGKRHMANEYVINKNVHLETKNVHLEEDKNTKMSTLKNVHLETKNVKMSTLIEKMSILESRINTMFERQNEILELLKMSTSNEKMSTLKNVHLENKNVPTDTDTDEDTDKNTIEISYCSDSTEDNNVEIKEKINKKEMESVVSDNGTNETQHNTSTKEYMNTKTDRETINNLKDEIKTQQDIMYHTQLQEAGEQAYNLMCVHMNNLKTLMSNEEYNEYRTHIKNWWRKTKKYLKWQTNKAQAEQIEKDKIESALQGYQYATDVETAKNMLQVLTNRIENYHGEDVEDIYTTYIAKVNDIRKSSPIHEQAYNIIANGEDVEQPQTNATEATETPQIQSQTAQVEQLPTEDVINGLCAYTEDEEEIITDSEKPNDADEEIEETPNLDVNLDNRIVNEDEFEAFWSTLDDDDRYIGSPKVA